MSSADDAVKLIDRQELIDLALTICNIDSAGPTEARVAEYIYDWIRNEGFSARKTGLLADRFNVIGTLPGSGGGCSLIFNSHMDTAVRSWDTWRRRDPTADIFHKAWIEGDQLVGEGIVNDKGPLAAFLIAAKAVKATGKPLKGDLLVSGVVGETSREPSDDPPGTIIETKDLGARFLVTHGGVADYALIAEGTGFSIVTVEAGEAWFKISFLSDQPGFYTPYLPDRTTMEESPNMIVRAAAAIRVLEQWAAEYQKRYAYEGPSGPVIPKAQVGAIRGGDSTGIGGTPEVCSFYLGIFIVPDQNPLDLKEELQETLKAAGVPPTRIELYHFRRGYEARNVDRLKDAVLRAHIDTFGTPPQPPNPATCSMWRDVNIFNELGIPALTYGPRSDRHSHKRAFAIEALYQASVVYARTIVDLCNQDRPKPDPRARQR
ncbi:MAG TPA: M20/M25/M40 family metallo-hydrolase [Candidatus Binatia bacterium]|jgi:acetylornithine deacetylase/succinyl-diaminopimelate desuccinylase-like protein